MFVCVCVCIMQCLRRLEEGAGSLHVSQHMGAGAQTQGFCKNHLQDMWFNRNRGRGSWWCVNEARKMTLKSLF